MILYTFKLPITTNAWCMREAKALGDYTYVQVRLEPSLLADVMCVGPVSDCRSRGREFDFGPVPYFRGD